MKITKYEHSCLDIEENGQRLLIDPGVVTSSIPNYKTIAAVIVTHMHPDHLDAEKLLAIHAQNPDAPIYTVPAVANELNDTVPVIVVSNGQTLEIGPFQLEFSGEKHAVIHKSVPATDNIGATINNKIFFPGDSLDMPKAFVDTLALPITAPWLKISDAMDFITAFRPKRVFPVHDALLSNFGMKVNNGWLQRACESVGAEYIIMKPGNSLSV